MSAILFKEGDRVKVVKSVFKESGWNNSWVHEMYEAVGNVYTVSYVNDAGVHFKERIGDYTYGFPPSSLQIEGITIPVDSDAKYINLNFQKWAYPIKHVQAFEYAGEVFNNEADARKAALVDMIRRIVGVGFNSDHLKKLADNAESIKEAIEKAYA